MSNASRPLPSSVNQANDRTNNSYPSIHAATWRAIAEGNLNEDPPRLLTGPEETSRKMNVYKDTRTTSATGKSVTSRFVEFFYSFIPHAPGHPSWKIHSTFSTFFYAVESKARSRFLPDQPAAWSARSSSSFSSCVCVCVCVFRSHWKVSALTLRVAQIFLL